MTEARNDPVGKAESSVAPGTVNTRESGDGLSVVEGLAALFARGPKWRAGEQGVGELPALVPADAGKFDIIYRVLAQQIPAVVFLAFLDEGMGQAYVSPHIEAVLGFTQSEWLEDPVRWYRQLHPEDKQRWSIDAAQMLLAGTPVQSVYRVISRDGSVIWLQCDARLLRHENGEPWIIHGVAFDITDLKRSQAELEHSRDALEAKVQERTAELAETVARLEREIAERARIQAEVEELNRTLETRVLQRTQELHAANTQLLQDIAERRRLEQQLLHAQKMESIGTLAGGIAHDFNNILNIIQGYACILTEPSPGHAAIAQSAIVIQDSVRRGASLVQQLLTIGRKTEPNLMTSSVEKIIEGVMVLVRQTIPKVIELDAQVSGSLPAVTADANQIGQVLLNLCINARDAMPQGGKLTIRALEGKASQQSGEGKPSVCIEVSDTGTGMSQDVQRRIFEPFFTTKASEQGTGLGLSVAYAIMENHGGSIHVESQPMQGTTFRLFLPVDASNPGKVPNRDADVASSPIAVQNGRPTILLVEDEQLMLSLLTETLTEKGYRVFGASDGESAIEIFQRSKYEIDAVLLDIGLPRVSGWEVFLQMQKEMPDVKAIFASGYLEPDLRSSMQKAGITHVIGKPYIPNDVLRALENLIAA